MATQFSRTIVGAVAVVSFAALVIPHFFNEQQDCGCAQCNGSICAEPKPISSQEQDLSTGVVDEGAELAHTYKEQADQDAGGVQANGEHDIVPQAETAEELGYAALLEEEGSPALALNEPLDHESGVVVGVRPQDENNTFVSNPVVTGNSPADAAKKRAEIQKEADDRAKIAAKKQQEAERLAMEARKKQEAERLAMEAKKKQETERLAMEAKKKQEAEAKLAMQIEQKKANESSKLKSGEIRKLGAQPVGGVPSGRYLQLGVFSSEKNANEARGNFRFKMGPAEYNKAGRGFGFKVDNVTIPGKYVLLLGPSKSEEVLQNLKSKQFNKAFIVSR